VTPRVTCSRSVILPRPFAKGLGGGQHVLDLDIVEEPPRGHVDGDHLSRAQRALFDTTVASSVWTMPASDPAISSPSPVTT
jgi:hypothetical protein